MSMPLFNALVVDDDAIARKTVRFALENEGFKCVEAKDGDEALRCLAENACDLVVTDICMPRMHGHSLAIELLKRNPRPMVVVHTSYDDPRLTREMMERGVEDIIFKPSNYPGFAAKARVMVERRLRSLSSPNVVKTAGNEKSSLDDENSLGENSSPRSIDVYLSCVTPDAALEELIEFIQSDALLTENIIRASNSSEFNRSDRTISDLREAVCRLGFRRVGDLALNQLKAARV